MVGSGTDVCTVTLTAPAPSGGLSVELSSSSSAVSVQETVTVPANTTSAGFNVAVFSVAAAQAVTMTASTGSVFTSFILQLNAVALALSINATSVAFGDVVVDTSLTQSVTLTSTGTAPLTVGGATLTGAGFTLSGSSLPVTLSPGQEATLNIEFDPTALGMTTGELIIASNSSTDGSAVINLSGIGTPAPVVGTPPVVTVAVTPATATTTAGATQQFAASVTGTSNTAVTWIASGAGCAGAACGSITSTGLYTAPAVVPSPASIAITATSASDPTQSASAAVTIGQAVGTKYYIAPAVAGGNDTNNGLSPGAPWLTPNHSVKCGDVITAAPGSYVDTNFRFNQWGVVTCPAMNNVAWLICASFDSCKITVSGTENPMAVTESYWGVAGWEVNAINDNNGCFVAYPPSSSTQIHHVVFADNVANGCYNGGFTSGSEGAVGVDYLAIVGNIAYNGAQSTSSCTSGIDIVEPVNSDSAPGTHIYIAGNFTWGNVDHNPCAGGPPTDGEGIVLDTLNSPSTYSGQILVDNNISIANGGRGFNVYQSPAAQIYERHNTFWGNNTDSNQNDPACGESVITNSSNTQTFLNLSATNATDGCGGNPIYDYFVYIGDVTDKVYDNFGYAASGTNSGATNSPGFSYGPNNLFGANPQFVNPTAPGAPNCSGYANVPACMAQVIANFTPANAAAQGYGYQVTSSQSIYDPLFPQWLCNVNLPPGLVTVGCNSQP
ncbi:MAG: choice-of-anchor D domain-containing protein [Terracidiphilus sp.]